MLASRARLAGGGRRYRPYRAGTGRGCCRVPKPCVPHRFQCHDLSDSFPSGSFDLVSDQFLHSPVSLDRTRVLRNAARAVAPNGTLLIVDHGSAPPWAWNLAHEHYFPSAEEVVESLRLNADQWQRLRVGSAERQATGPDGQHATVTDNLIALRRIG